jgi:hypothetical protein
VFVVRLEANPATLAERIIDRGPASWSGLAGLVQHTQELALNMPALGGVDLVLSTDRQRAEDVAARIRAARPDRLLASTSPPYRAITACVPAEPDLAWHAYM